MPKSLLVKILDEIMADKRFNVKEICLWSAGEPLLHTDFVGIMKIIAKFKDKYKHFPKVKIMTNSMLLTKKMSDNIIKIGAIDYIGFSIDGGSKKAYEKLRPGGKFDIVIGNIDYFLKKNNKKIETMVNCVIPLDKPLDTSWMSKEFIKLLESVDFYKLTYPDNNGGDELVKYPKKFKFFKTNQKICLALIQGLVIVQNGDVLICCNDFNAKYPFGNIHVDSLFDIVNSQIRKDIVKKFFEDGKDSLYLCSTCNRFETPFKITRK
jgi:sulfatase maturation enzyme AslB (radical SAM superfamily)